LACHRQPAIDLPFANGSARARAEIAVDHSAIIPFAGQRALNIHNQAAAHFAAHDYRSWAVVVGIRGIIIGSINRQADPDAHTRTAIITTAIITVAMPVSQSGEGKHAQRRNRQ